MRYNTISAFKSNRPFSLTLSDYRLSSKIKVELSPGIANNIFVKPSRNLTLTGRFGSQVNKNSLVKSTCKYNVNYKQDYSGKRHPIRSFSTSSQKNDYKKVSSGMGKFIGPFHPSMRQLTHGVRWVSTHGEETNKEAPQTDINLPDNISGVSDAFAERDDLINYFLTDNNYDTLINTWGYNLLSYNWELLAGKEAFFRPIIQAAFIASIPVCLARRKYNYAIISAAKNNDIKYLKELPISARMLIKTNFKDVRGDTALHHAIRHGNRSISSYLISQGPNFSQKNVCGRTTWYEASARGFIPILRDLHDQIREHEHPNWYSLFPRSKFAEILNQTTGKNWTPLCSAIAYGHTATAEYLLNFKEIELNQVNDQGYTALFWAIKRSNYPIVLEILRLTLQRMTKFEKIKVGSVHNHELKDPSEHLWAHNHDGGNMFHIAAKSRWSKSSDILRSLLNLSVDLPDDKLPKLVQLVHELALPSKEKKEPNKKPKSGMSGRHGRSPLHEACVYGRLENMKVFIEMNDQGKLPIDFTHESQSGRNMIEIASIYGAAGHSLKYKTVASYDEIVGLLLDRIEREYKIKIKVIDECINEFDDYNQFSNAFMINKRLNGISDELWGANSYHRDRLREHIEEEINSNSEKNHAADKARHFLFMEKARLLAGLHIAYKQGGEEKFNENKKNFKDNLLKMYACCSDLTSLDYRGYTLLHYVVRYNDPKLIAQLFEKVKEKEGKENFDLKHFANDYNVDLVYGPPIFDCCIFNSEDSFDYLLYDPTDKDDPYQGMSADIFRIQMDRIKGQFKQEERSTKGNSKEQTNNQYKSTLLLAAAYSVRGKFLDKILKEADEKLSPKEFVE